ncbi:MAG: murein biosynthesis integral membrane protein MurJ, partial [Ktedonobacterales bacterium]
ALKQVVFPAFATGIYHVAIVVCGVGALFLASRQLGVSLGTLTDASITTAATVQGQTLGAQGLAVGAALGAACEFLILLPGLRRVGVGWRPVLDLRHPGVRQILRLYVPLLAGLLLSIGQQVLDTTLWGHSPGGAEDNTTALLTGTTLVQFPVGLVTAALSFAVLPLLTAAASRDAMDDFKRTLVQGIRLGLLLMVPAMVGLIALRMPILTLLFEHGRCGSGCTTRNALALQNYAYELPFIALDQLLIAAFYARKNTLTPNIVGAVSIGFYLLVALPFGLTIGLPALAFADTAKNTSHALILFVLLTLAIGDLGMRNLLDGLGRIVVAAAAMGVVCVAAVAVLPSQLPGLFSLAHTPGRALTLIVAGALGVAVYFGLVTLLRVEEVRMIGGIVRSRLRGRG